MGIHGAAAQDAAAQQLTPALQATPGTSSEGHLVLAWTLPSAQAHGVLQQGTSPQFTSPLETPIDHSGSIVVTGLRDGVWYFRAGVPGNWSAVQQVEVAHHALSLALVCFVLGFVVFALLTAVILHGSRGQRGAHV